MTAASPLLLSLRACIVLCKKKSSRPRFTALSFKITIANHGLRFRTSNLIVDPKCSHDTARRELRKFATTFYALHKKSSLTCSTAPRFKTVTASLGHRFVPPTWELIHGVHMTHRRRALRRSGAEARSNFRQ